MRQGSYGPWSPESLPPNPGEDFDRMLETARKTLTPRRVAIGAAALLGLGAVATSYYQIEPDEVGVVQRLGRFHKTAEPGPHFALPFGIDRVVKVPVQRQLKMEFGFRSERSPSIRNVDLQRESLMLTGDLNVAVVEWIVQYKVKDPYQYLFQVRNVDQTLRDLSEAAMRTVIGDHSVNEVLTTGRQKIAGEAQALLQSLANQYGTGVDVEQVVLQDVNPPDPVKPSFNEVNQAIQEKERAINEAHAEFNQAVPRARGEAEQAVKAAEGYAIERVNRAKGEADRFLAILETHRAAPEVTRTRMYLEAMTEVLPRAGTKMIVGEGADRLTPLLRMDLQRPVQTAAITAAEPVGGAR